MKKAFTLIEALAVLAILATVVGLLAPAIMAARDHSFSRGEQPQSAAQQAASSTILLDTVTHDGHLWVMSVYAGVQVMHFVHHPDCQCHSRKAESE